MNRLNVRWMIVLIALSGCAAQDRAQDRGAPEGVAPAGTEVESHLYSAELVLDHQTAIGLTDAQRAAIRAELQRSQSALVDAEIELRAHREALAGIVAAPRVDEERAMEAAARVADDERAIKLDHLRLLVRIKNHLTQDQQRILDGRRSARGM
jgi:Spy/CpxP family protein refolding chaperone